MAPLIRGTDARIYLNDESRLVVGQFAHINYALAHLILRMRKCI